MAHKKSNNQTKGAPRAKRNVTTDESTDGAEGRVDQRVPIQLLVDYRADGSYLFDFCRDLGTGGVFIQTSKPLPTGSTIDLTFTIPDSKETLNTKGTVIWAQQPVGGRKDLVPGMGVQFSGFSGEQRRLLEGFVERYHGGKLVTTSASNRADKQAV
jgi:type IV pilus assembly protein PilZ